MLPVITYEGRLTADPELRFTPSGKAVANFTVVANDRKKNNETGQWEDGEALFIRVSTWDAQAENVCESLSKGDLVVVVGRLTPNSFEDRDGNKREGLEMKNATVAPSLRFATAKISRVTRSTQDAQPSRAGQPSQATNNDDEPPPF